ncbi:MAG: hypothetical protein U0992_20560 [Planctomycetaceae bacterium]
MPTTRPRRIVRRAVVAVAVVVLLLGWYFASVMCLGFAVGAGWVINPTPIVIAPLMPMQWYVQSARIGSSQVGALGAKSRVSNIAFVVT